MAIVEISDKEFESEVVGATGIPVLVDFWAPWCGPCKMLSPILDEVFEEIGDQVKIVKMNVDENTQVAGRLGVMSIPTLMVFKDGEMVSKLLGVRSKEHLIEWIKEYV